VKAWKA